MVRQLNYRSAIYAFVFTGLWFVIGAVLLATPLISAMGIGGEFFAVWLLLFFLALGASGFMLTAAALNTAFAAQRSRTARRRTQRGAQPRSSESLWAPPGEHAGATPRTQRPGGRP